MPTVDEMLAEARTHLDRVTPAQAREAMERDSILVDIRSDEQRARDGEIPGAVRIARNVMEWRCDPAGDARDPQVSDPSKPLILFCDEGYASSLAARILQDLGHPRATDLDGGFRAWRAEGLPVTAPDVT
jgi:rhodanese-related sulfurtransferase